jgi:hypothetical protein
VRWLIQPPSCLRLSRRLRAPQRVSRRREIPFLARCGNSAKWLIALIGRKTVVLEPSGGVRIHLKTEGDGAITTSSRSRRASATRTKAKHKGKEISAASRTSMTRVLKKRRWRLKGLAGQILRRRSFNVWKESINISELIKATSLLSTTRTTRSSKRA